MDCRTARSLIPFAGSRHGQLAGPDQRALADHVRVCSRCAAAVRADRDLESALFHAPTPDVPAGLRDRLLAHLEPQRQALHNRWWRRLATGLGSAAALLLAVAGWWFWSHGGAELDADLLVARLEIPHVAADPRDDVADWFRARGVVMTAPARLNYGLLRSCDLIEFEGRTRVPQLLLTLAGREGYAKVVLLRRSQFRFDEARHAAFAANSQCQVQILDEDERYYVVVIYAGAPLDAFLRPDATVLSA